MTGSTDRPSPFATLKRPAVLAGVAVVLVAAATTGAWLTRRTNDTSPGAAVAAEPISPALAQSAGVVDPPLAAPPPPTSADFDNATLVDVKIVDAKAEETKPVDAKAAELKPADAKTDWEAMPIRELRTRAEGNEILAMEELARRLLQGVGVTKDAQAGAGWLLRAAQGGSAQAAFNVGVMYERGFVVERDSSKAIEWYRKAVDADMPMAKHNLALLLRDGKGAARNGKEAVELLRSATRQGMVASMFTLGDIYERGDAAPKDQAAALAWFTIASELDRQMNKGEETPLSKTSGQRAQTLQRLLTPGELERAQQVGQDEFKQIVEALQPPKPASLPQSSGLAPATPQIANVDPPGWPQAANEQVRATQQVLFDLKLLRDPPDGAIGPMTRTAIRTFQKSAGMRETGEPSKELYVAMRTALANRDVVANSPLPLPPKAEAKTEEKAQAPAAEPKAAPPVEQQAGIIDIGKPEPPPPPPTSIDIVRPTLPADATWPTGPADQIKAVQMLLVELNLLRDTPDGIMGPLSRAAIRDYEKAAGLRITGEPSKALFESLKERRRSATPTKP
jgi:TPR repeat protein/peptidoglycan hydrolase-like protein with peptidoglycan-binding domain